MPGAALLVLALPHAEAAVPRVVPKAVQVVEGDAAEKTIRVSLVLSRRAPRGASVRFRTRAGTAGADDFRARSGTVRFRRGSRRAVVALRIRGDLLEEPDERFSAVLSSPRRLRLGRARTVRITITDDDPAVVAALPDVSVTEPPGADGVASHGVAITLSRAPKSEARVDFQLVGGGNATAADLDLAAGTVTFAPGVTRQTLPGVVRGDPLDELDETVTVVLTNPVGLRLPDPQATLTIGDDPNDVPPAVSVGDVTISEATGSATVPITLSAPSGRAVSVPYSTQDGTADGADHGGASGTVTFGPDVTGAAVVVPVTNDARDEDEQSFTVALAQPDGATVADGAGAVTITDDDPPPTVSIADVTVQEANVVAMLQVSLSTPSEKVVGFNVSTSSVTASGGGSCSVGIDYVSLSNVPFQVAPGDTTRAVNVMVCGDAVDENTTETASVFLTNLANSTPGDVSAQLAILDNDP